MAVAARNEAESPPQRQEALRNYNYRHFQTRHLAQDFVRTARGEGIRPGQMAPDFELESVEGDRLRLSALRGRPVVLHFGSVT